MKEQCFIQDFELGGEGGGGGGGYKVGCELGGCAF